MEELGSRNISCPEKIKEDEIKVIIEEAKKIKKEKGVYLHPFDESDKEAKKRKKEMEACFAALEEKREENKIYYFKKSLRKLIKSSKDLIRCIIYCETLGAHELYEKETTELGEEISLFRKELENQDEMFLENFFNDETTTQKEINKLKKEFDKLTKKAKGIHFQEDLEEMWEMLYYMLSHFKPL